MAEAAALKLLACTEVSRGAEGGARDELDFDEHDKLSGSSNKRYLSLDEIKEFETLMEKKNIIKKGGLLKKGGILDKAGLLKEIKENPNEPMLAERVLPAIGKAVDEKRRVMAVGRGGKKSPQSSSYVPRRVSASVNRQRVLKEIRGKQQKTLTKEDKDNGTEGEMEDGTESEPQKEENPSNEKDTSDLEKDGKASNGRETTNGDNVVVGAGNTEKRTESGEKKENKKRNSETMKEGKDPSKNNETMKEGKDPSKNSETMKEGKDPSKNSETKEEGKDSSKNSETKEAKASEGGTKMNTNHNSSKETEKKSGSKGKTACEDLADICTYRSLLYSSEKLTDRPGKDGDGAPVVSYRVALRCQTSGVNQERILELWEVPKTGTVIKDRIQRQFQIPTSFQSDLSFKGKTIEDSTAITSIGLKAGAKMELTYQSEGELEEVRVVMKWYEYLVRLGKDYHPSIFTGLPTEFSMICYRGVNEKLAERLAYELLEPWDSPIKHTNAVYFFQENGLEDLLNVYEMLIRENWRTMNIRMKLLEAGCILVMGSLASSMLNRQRVITADGHGFVMHSFLRVLVRRGSPLIDTSGAPGPTKSNYFLLKEIIDSALRFFINFRDCSEIHMDICSKNNAVEQVISIAHSHSFTVQQAQECICLLACCMHSPDTHKPLCKNSTLEGIVNCVKVHRERGLCENDQLILLHYYAQVTLAHLAISSSSYMSRKIVDKLIIFMEEFLRTVSPSTIQKLEKASQLQYGWSPFLPYLKVLFSPLKSKPPSRTGTPDDWSFFRLHELTIETIMFVVQVMATNNPYRARKQLLEEKLLPYALCLSAIVPRHHLSSARLIVSSLRSDSSKPVPIPKLNVMARAKLASIYFGLKKVMDRTADELKLEVLPPPPPPRTVTKSNNPMLYIFSM